MTAEEEKNALDQLIEERLGQFGPEAMAILERSIVKAGLVTTGHMLNNLKYHLARHLGNTMNQFILSYDDYGRIVEMKFRNYNRLPPLNPLEEWVRRKGVAAFPYVPGYTEKSKKVPTEDQKINRIAWGLRVAKKNTPETRPRQWMSNHFYRLLRTHINILLEDAAKRTGQVIALSWNIRTGREQ